MPKERGIRNDRVVDLGIVVNEVGFGESSMEMMRVVVLLVAAMEVVMLVSLKV